MIASDCITWPQHLAMIGAYCPDSRGCGWRGKMSDAVMIRSHVDAWKDGDTPLSLRCPRCLERVCRVPDREKADQEECCDPS